MPRHGVLASQHLNDFFDGGFIAGIEKQYINPASVDLALGEEAYRLECVFLPCHGQTVRSMLELPALGATPHDLKSPLEAGTPYLIHFKGQFALPEGIYGYANPKSSVGRLNLFSRVVADGVPMYDAIAAGWTGELWMLVRPDSFPVLLSPGQALSQMRLFDGRGFLDEMELKVALSKKLLYHSDGKPFTPMELIGKRHADSLFLSAGVPDGLIGWECRGTKKVLDYGKVGCYRPEQFFSPVYAKRGSVLLRSGSFYILTSKEYVRVPPEFSAELRATDQRIGNLRVHAAGFIDSGWGYGLDGEILGRPITLEVTTNEDNILLQDGQPVARIKYEWMRERPEKLYDEVASNYTMQKAAQLSKHFRVAA